jgi:hypothetical protein
MTTAGRPYCNRLVLCGALLPDWDALHANHLKGVMKNYVLTVQKPQEQISLA